MKKQIILFTIIYFAALLMGCFAPKKESAKVPEKTESPSLSAAALPGSSPETAMENVFAGEWAEQDGAYPVYLFHDDLRYEIIRSVGESAEARGSYTVDGDMGILSVKAEDGKHDYRIFFANDRLMIYTDDRTITLTRLAQKESSVEYETISEDTVFKDYALMLQAKYPAYMQSDDSIFENALLISDLADGYALVREVTPQYLKKKNDDMGFVREYLYGQAAEDLCSIYGGSDAEFDNFICSVINDSENIAYATAKVSNSRMSSVIGGMLLCFADEGGANRYYMLCCFAPEDKPGQFAELLSVDVEPIFA